jgi:hypothetical protein
MIYRFLADALVLFHFTFVSFVIFGGLLVVRWPRVAFAHLPAAAWGVFVEFSHIICPLTPLENQLRYLGNESTYQGGFVDHYIMPVLYPAGLNMHPEIQYMLGGGILLLNITLYFIALRGLRSATAPDQPARPSQTSRPADSETGQS